MSEPNESEDLEIVDLDNCSTKKSILIGALVAVLLGFVQYSYMLLCVHFLLGGLATSGHFAKRYSITIPRGSGAKMGALAAFIGMLPILAIIATFLYTGFGEAEFEAIREEIVRGMYEEGNPEAAEYAENAVLADLKPAILAVVSAAGTCFSLAMGALGGLIGASLFKKGPEAR